MKKDHLKLAVWLDELVMSFDEGLAVVKELGVDYVWFAELKEETPIGSMSDVEVDKMASRIDHHGLKLYQICANHPLHDIELIDLTPGKAFEHPQLLHDFEVLVRSMKIAARIGVEAVLAYGLSWPGEWRQKWSKSPTWPMRWATQGGIISDSNLDSLVEVFQPIIEQAEKYEVDLVLGMRPFHFLNTSEHFCELAQRLDSRRLRAMWAPADCFLSGEKDIHGAGFERMSTYLHGLHLKDVVVLNGPQCKYEWKPLGEGQVDYPSIIHRLCKHDTTLYLGVATHFHLPGVSRVEAMRSNIAKTRCMLEQSNLGTDL